MSALTRRPAFWIAYALVAVLALVLAARLFPEAIPIVNLEIKLNRADALARAEALGKERGIAPPGARAAARFGHDGTAQNYVELEGGGKNAFAALTRGDLYAPYWWEVRLFAPGVIDEATLRFKPDGGVFGFVRTVPETYVRDPATKALGEPDARALAESRARSDWGFDLAPYKLIEHSQQARRSGRVDHAFVYERPERLGEASVRLRLTVAGDELVAAAPYFKIPDSFERRFEELRSTNDLIAAVASIAALLLYGVGGVVLGSLWLARRHWLVWRPALAAGAIVGLLLALALLASAPAAWFNVNTTETVGTFWTKQIGAALGLLVAGALGLGAVFMAAESLTRRAFPHHPQLWRVWEREPGASRQVLGRTLGGQLFVPLELALIALFYYGTNRWLGWWQPSEVLTDPNILGSAVPALGPISLSLQAGFMEECAFRAIPLALGALIGARFGHRTAGIVVAMILQALVFGAAHANYPGFPAYSRPLELFLPSIVWGLIFLRYGLLPTVILHGTFDLVLFAIPVFLLDAPGALLQQGLIVAAGVFPLAIVAWRIVRAGGVIELPVAAYNGAWQPTLPAEEPPAAVPAAHVDHRFAPLFQRMLPLVGVVGLAAWIVLGPFRVDVPAAHVGRAAAIAAAEEALAARGVRLGPEWERYAALRGAPDDASQWTMHKFVWREAGREAYRRLVGGVLAPPVWEVRFARFTGSGEERAEEWRFSVGPNGGVRGLLHTLPEAAAGASLDRAAAQALAEAELRRHFGLDASALREVGAEEGRRPARLDWKFTWADPRAQVGEGGEARYLVGLAGDQVSTLGRYVFVPQTWLRAELERSNRGQIAAIAAGFVLLGAGVVGLIIGVVAWTRHRVDVRALWLMFAFSVALILATAVNSLPITLFNLDANRPLWSQWLVRLLGTVSTAAVGALVLALLAGVGAWYARSAPRLPLAGRVPSWVAAVAGALLVLGVQTLLAGMAPRTAPLWPPLRGSELSPLLSALISGLGVVPYAGAALFVVYLVSRLTHGFTRHAWAGAAVLVLLQCAAALTQASGQYVGAVIAGVTGGLTAAAVLWWLIRYDVRMVPAYVATGTIASALLQAVQVGTAEGWLGFAVQALATAALAWAVTRYIDAPLAAAPAPPATTAASPSTG